MKIERIKRRVKPVEAKPGEATITLTELELAQLILVVGDADKSTVRELYNKHNRTTNQCLETTLARLDEAGSRKAFHYYPLFEALLRAQDRIEGPA